MPTGDGYGTDVVLLKAGEFTDEGAVPRLQRAGRGGFTFPEAGYNRTGSLSVIHKRPHPSFHFDQRF